MTFALTPTGSNRRYQVNAVHTSKACSVISKYTAFVPVDINKRQYLPMVVKYPNSGKAHAYMQWVEHVSPRAWGGAEILERAGGSAVEEENAFAVLRSPCEGREMIQFLVKNPTMSRMMQPRAAASE